MFFHLPDLQGKLSIVINTITKIFKNSLFLQIKLGHQAEAGESLWI